MSHRPLPRRKAASLHVLHALAALAALPLLAHGQQATDLGVVHITDSSVGDAVSVAPSQNSLEARSAQSIVSDAAIRNFTSPIADYAQVMDMTPGIFSYSPNGVGLGQASITIRGLSDSFTVFSFDGIPFNDTNGVSHHSWVFFPSQFLGGAVVDRSPGTAASIGQATFGGTVDLRSRVLDPNGHKELTASYGTWNTILRGVDYDTGSFGEHKSDLEVNAHRMTSDGYETFNRQDRKAASGKFQSALTKDTELTVFVSALDLLNNTPNLKGVTRANYLAGNYNYLLTQDPTLNNCACYNFYDIDTTFSYVGVTSNLGGGWKVDDKAYVYSYYNKQNYANGSKPGAALSTVNALPLAMTPSDPLGSTGLDKLNSYVTFGDLLRLTQDSSLGTLRTGVWLDIAHSHRYQLEANPTNWVDFPIANFQEQYKTTTVQPYLEYTFKVTPQFEVTPGVKYANYRQDFVHNADLGSLSTTLTPGYPTVPVGTSLPGVIGPLNGAATLGQGISYHDVLPALDLHYLMRPNWSLYAQYAAGDEIPSTGVFDVPNAKVSTPPKATRAKTLQLGTVYTGTSTAVSADVYRTVLGGTYTGTPPDPVTGYVTYYPSGNQLDQGFEAEVTQLLGHGFSVYANATIASVTYDATGLWVAGAPNDTETVALNWTDGHWDTSVSANNVGRMYNDNGTTHQAFRIGPVLVTNAFANYTFTGLGSTVKSLKLQFAINNVLNQHSIVAVPGPKSGSSSSTPNAADLLTILPERSESLTATVEF